MDVTENYNLYLKFDEDLFLLVYMGEFNDNLTPIITGINSSTKFGEINSKKRLTYLITECFQNIVRHSAKKHNSDLISDVPEMFVFKAKENIQQVISTNAIREDYVTILRSKLESIHNLSAQELKNLYIEVIKNGQRTERGGAGLGLIDMARKSGMAPAYYFDHLGNGFSNFFFQVNIPDKNSTEVFPDHVISLDSAIELYKKMSGQRLLILQKGDFNQDLILQTISLFATNLNLKTEQVGRASKMIYILIEMLQNISRHAYVLRGLKEGMFYITELSDLHYRICTCNYISISKTEDVKSAIDKINMLDKIGLAKLYKHKLMENTGDEQIGAGIGLVEMRRNSIGQINYDIRNIDNEYNFLALQVDV